MLFPDQFPIVYVDQQMKTLIVQEVLIQHLVTSAQCTKHQPLLDYWCEEGKMLVQVVLRMKKLLRSTDSVGCSSRFLQY